MKRTPEMTGARSRRCHVPARRDDEGATAVAVAILIPVLLALAAMAVDVGALYAHRREIQTAADAAALAGVQELPYSPASAAAVAENYGSINAAAATDAQFTIGSTYIANDTITVDLRDPAMGLFFARVMGMDTAPVGAHASAVIGSPSTYGSGVMPFGICATGTTDPPYGYDVGQTITLINSEVSEQGNWYFVDLTGWTEDGDNVKEIISFGGTTEPLSIYDFIDTQTGSPLNPDFGSLVDYFEETCGPHSADELRYDAASGLYQPRHADGSYCNRLIVCPVIIMTGDDPYAWPDMTGTETVQVIGFLNVFVSNNPDFKDGILNSTFVQVVPVDTFDPGAYTEYGGVIFWLSE